MSWVKTFRIHPNYGLPDQEIREFISSCEDNCIVDVEAVFIPAYGFGPDGTTADPRLTIIVTKLDDFPVGHGG